MLFSRHGYRRTSVEDIAREADVSKGTVYIYFENKEALLRACVGRFAALLEERTWAALNAGGTMEETLTALLEAKFLLGYSIICSAPHAQELIDSSNALASDLVEKMGAAYRGRMERFLAERVFPERPHLRSIGDAKELVDLLIAAGDGLSRTADSEEDLAKALSRLVRIILVPIGSTEKDASTGMNTAAAEL